MSKSVPTKASTKKAGKSGLTNGGVLGAGEVAGRAVLGRGVGTAVGGILAAASESGQNRDMMALVAVERAANELTSGSGA
jgi:hypothetical protein